MDVPHVAKLMATYSSVSSLLRTVYPSNELATGVGSVHSEQGYQDLWQRGCAHRSDNGRVLHILYSNGIQSAAAMTGIEDVYAWDNYVDTYNDEGVRATRLVTYDDGSEVFTHYLA